MAGRVWRAVGVLAVATFLLPPPPMGPVVADGAFRFLVGGRTGWIKPAAGGEDVYNEWARRNRFHVGDSLYFKYTNDSVLVVEPKDYDKCNAARPLQEFTDGDTTFTFRHFGFFYFISGESGHCESGQRLIVRVMVHHRPVPVASAPTPLPGGGGDDVDSAPVPTKRSVAPPQADHVPAPAPGEPPQADDVPAPAPNEPRQAEYVPAPAPGEPPQADHVPAPAPGVPSQRGHVAGPAPGEPAKSSVAPPQGGRVADAAPGAPRKSSGKKKSTITLRSSFFMPLFIVPFLV